MQTYELTIALPGNATAAKKKESQKKLESLIKIFEGKLIENNEWGKLELAYPIKDNEEALFLHYVLELNADQAKNIQSKLNLEEDVLRYLLVKGKGKASA